MSRPIVWLTGPPGSGKTTAGRAAASILELEYRSAGDLFRSEARREGASLEEFSRYAELHPEVDKALDEKLMAATGPGTLLEGRVVGALLRRRGTVLFSLMVTAREEIRAERIARRDGGDVATALRLMRSRSASERDRYLRFYGIDLDREPVDATVDASDLAPSAVSERIVELVRGWEAGP